MRSIRPNAVGQVKVDIGEEAAKHGQKLLVMVPMRMDGLVKLFAY
ncbi:MAG: hypothetical protein ACLTY5_12000 [Angelakisella sp.]